jgi:hypothetical protein
MGNIPSFRERYKCADSISVGGKSIIHIRRAFPTAFDQRRSLVIG